MMSVGKKRIARDVLILLAVVLLAAGCSSRTPRRWGKVLKYKGGSLFYTSRVTEEEARRLGDYLLKVGFFKDDEPCISQLTKEGGVYQFRMVVDKEVIEKKPAPETMGPVEVAGLLAQYMSERLFNGAKVEWHLCDDKLKTLRVGSY